MTKVSARWVPKLLNDSQKAKRAEVSRKNLRLYQGDPEAFLNRMVTVDKTWVHHFTPETKEQSKQWKHPGSPPPKKGKSVPSAGKIIATVFWDSD